MNDAWNEERLKNYFHNCILYFKIAGLITEEIATLAEKKKQEVIDSILSKGIPLTHYPFVLVTWPKIYFLIDVDPGFDLTEKRQEEIDEIINSRNRYHLNHDEMVAVEKTHEIELTFKKESEDLATTLSLRIQFMTRGSYSGIIYLN